MMQNRLQSLKPSGVHVWAQADRYALAAQFYERNSPIYEAYTYYMGSKNGRVGVEFPLVPWLSARFTTLLNLSQAKLPLVYRWTNWFFTFLGIWCVGGLIGKRPNNHYRRFWASILLLSSPVVLFYGFGFIPDAASAGISLFSASFLLSYFESSKRSHAFLALFFAALAALIKITAGVFLIAAYLAILFFENRKTYPSVSWTFSFLFSLFFFLSAAGIGAYDYYLVHQVNINYYAPVFMSKMNPVSGWNEWLSILKAMRFWNSEYLSQPQYFLAAFSLLYAGLETGKRLRNRLFNPRFIYSTLLVAGMLLWSILFGRQLPDHDYYFLSSFYPLLLIFILYLVQSLYHMNGCFGRVLIPVFALWSFSISLDQFELRQSDQYRQGSMAVNNHVEWLQQMNHPEKLFPENSLVFVFYEFEPNLSLVYLGRRGMVFNHEEMGRTTDHIAYWANRLKPERIVMRNQWISTFKRQKPVWFEEMEVLFDNGTYSIFTAPRSWTLKH